MGRTMNVSPSVTLTPPVWAGEFLSPQRLIPAGGKLLLTEFRRPDAVLVKLSAAHTAGGTSLTVDPLVAAAGQSNPVIPNGTILWFGLTKFAVVNDAAVNAGDTTITVLATPTNIADNDEAYYAGVYPYAVVSGTVIGRTFAERASGTRYGPAASGDEDVFIVAFDESDIEENDGDVTLVKPGTVIKENFLPGWTGLAAAVQALVRDRYVTQVGVA